ELEAFVHGALCMCVSGQCLMSSLLGSRSGNRGLCAQPCRLPFGVNSKGGSNLSLKDLSLVNELERLKSAGVCSFKIEGRMKRPEYVAAAVTACKNSLNRITDKNIEESLQAVFSRSGFTKGYFEGRLGKEMFGTRRKEDVESASGVLKELSRLYEKENPLIPVDFRLTFKKSVPLMLEASALDKTVCAESEVCPEAALNKPLGRDELITRLSKCGGTQFIAQKVEIDFEEGLNVAASALNSLRRDVLEKLESIFCRNAEKSFNNDEYTFNIYTAKSTKLRARFFSENQIPDDLSGIESVILPLDVSFETVEKIKALGIETAAEIPCGVFSNSEKYANRLVELKAHGLDLACASNLDGIGIAQKADIPFISGFGMNIFNSISIDEVQKLGARDCLISCELPLNAISRLGGTLPRGVFAYGRIPLMLTRNCPVRNKLTCAECKGKSVLVDRMGVEFPVVCGNGCSTVLNSRPLWLADKKQDIKNVDFSLLYFTTESKSECKKVISAYKEGSAPTQEFTRGLYYKGVL
ncbi:MAG: U32 family peptidase, partial [Clostridia bacterium]|nr:U32 family peptidase [Clostridia bacterium]